MNAVVLGLVAALAYDLEHALQYSCEALPSSRAKSEWQCSKECMGTQQRVYSLAAS